MFYEEMSCHLCGKVLGLLGQNGDPEIVRNEEVEDPVDELRPPVRVQVGAGQHIARRVQVEPAGRRADVALNLVAFFQT
jgi:1,6-anhydro-N-acetylmuramate kinase